MKADRRKPHSDKHENQEISTRSLRGKEPSRTSAKRISGKRKRVQFSENPNKILGFNFSINLLAAQYFSTNQVRQIHEEPFELNNQKLSPPYMKSHEKSELEKSIRPPERCKNRVEIQKGTAP